MIKIGVLGSGTGSNFAAIAAAINSKKITGAEISIVISDVENAKILDRAVDLGIPNKYIPADDFKTKLDGKQEQDYIKALKSADVDYIILAGFMRMIKNGLLNAFPYKIINIHPALLPAFPGLHSWKQALDYGAKFAGCTVHFVDAGMDSGPIIAQAAVPIEDNDTAETLHARIQEQEHIIFPEVIQLLANGKVKIEGRKVKIENCKSNI